MKKGVVVEEVKVAEPNDSRESLTFNGVPGNLSGITRFRTRVASKPFIHWHRYNSTRGIQRNTLPDNVRVIDSDDDCSTCTKNGSRGATGTLRAEPLS